jgi:hypothetical protein
MDTKTPVDILASDNIEQPQGKAGQVSVPVCDRKCEGGRLVGHDEVRNVPTKFQTSKTVLREQSGYHDKAEHHREEQIKQIVACVDRGKPDPECEEKKPGPLRCETNRPPSRHTPGKEENWGDTEVEE